MNYDIFLSYSRANADIAKALVKDLESRGVRVWWDQKIGAGQDWRDSIVEHLADSSALVILFSEQCNQSKQLKKELGSADHMDKKVIPVLIEDTQPKGHFLYELASRNWVQVYPDALSKIDQLGNDLCDVVGTCQAPDAKDEQPAEEVKKKKEPKAKRDFLPVRWFDVIPIGAGTYALHKLIEPFVEIGHNFIWVDVFIIAVALYGAIVFPIRYYLRRRSPYRTFGWLMLTNLFLLIAMVATWLLTVYYLWDPTEVKAAAATIPWIGAAFAGIFVISFVIYALMSAVRARKILRANTKKI